MKMTQHVENPWALEGHRVVDLLETNLAHGLSDEEVRNRARLHGENVLPSAEATPFIKLVAKQFEDLLVVLLLLAAVVSFVLALFEDETDRMTAFVEPVVILLILVANATVGVVQETNAERAIRELKAYEAAYATVLRNGKTEQISARDLVPGDIVTVKVGDKIPADCRIVAIHSSVLTVDQSILTGESDSVVKQTSKVDNSGPSQDGSGWKGGSRPRALVVNQDMTNMLFSGTLATHGRAVTVVTATGINTAIGKIHGTMLEQEEEKTPLKIQLDKFGEQLSKLIGIICITVWLINVGHFNDPVHGSAIKGAIYYFKIAVALAVAAVPEGLPAVVTTCLALGTRAMAKKGAIVRSLPSVETLGCTTVICVDKTGTLTTNQMAVERIVFATRSSEADVIQFSEVEVGGNDYNPDGVMRDVKSKHVLEHPTADHPVLAEVARVCALCNNAKLHYNATSKSFEKTGEPTEAALRALVEKIGLLDDHLGLTPRRSVHAEIERGGSEEAITATANACSSFWESEFKRETVLEFTRNRKSMGVICSKRGLRALFVKGAPESIIERCINVRLDSGGLAKVTPEFKANFLRKVEILGKGACRCLALAQGEAPAADQEALDVKNSDHFEAIEQHLTLIGLLGMRDPTRENAKSAAKKCQGAGIRVVVLTGDNQATANAVCQDIGLFPKPNGRGDLTFSEETSLTGGQWSQLSETEKLSMLNDLVVLSRVEPSHKLEIVKMLKAQGEVVAMTGDGVNDAPALKKADIGIAMGSGTAVAKEASDLVLVNDDFETIVAAVSQGRSIFANTKQFIRYLISSNLGEVACIFFAAALSIPEALSPVQLLWVNLVTDGFPATALGFNKPDTNIMRTRPRPRNANIGKLYLRFAKAQLGANFVT